MSEMTAIDSAVPSRPINALRIVTLVFLVLLAGVLAVNLFSNMGNILYYVDLAKRDHARLSAWAVYGSYVYVVLAVIVMVLAAVRMFERTWHFAMLAQVAAIINAFTIIFLWGFNVYFIAQRQLNVEIPTEALWEAAALVLANIVTAGMLSGVIRQRKTQ